MRWPPGVAKDEQGPIGISSLLSFLSPRFFKPVAVRHLDRGPLPFQVIGQQHVRRLLGQLDQRRARVHPLDAEQQRPAKHLGEVLRVLGDVITRRVEVVELTERRHPGRIAKVRCRA